MELELTGNVLSPLALAVGQGPPRETDSSLDIEIDDQMGLIRIVDPRLFQPSRRRYLRQLVEAICDQPGVRRAEIDLASSACRVDFDLVANSPAVMAGVIVSAIGAVRKRGVDWSWFGYSPKWSTLTGFRAAAEVSVWETHENGAAQRFVHFGAGGEKSERSALAAELATIDEGTAFHVARWSRRLTVVIDKGLAHGARTAVDRLERLVESGSGANTRSAVSFMAGPARAPEVATGWKRWRNLAMAGGSFVLTLVGLVVPGVPTVPFLLATSYYLARSSPSLDARLRHTVYFGPILREWEEYGGLSVFSKGKLVATTCVIVVVTVLLAPFSPVAILGILFVSAASVYGIYQIPNLEVAAAKSPAALKSAPATPIG